MKTVMKTSDVHPNNIRHTQNGVHNSSGDTSNKDMQKQLLKSYNEVVLDSENKLPTLPFTNARSKHNKTQTKAKIPRTRKLRESDWKKGRPVFTEGLSSRSKQEDPVFYLRNQLILSSNQPGGVHYVRDKSKLILGATQHGANSKKSSKPTVPNLHIELGTLSEGLQITRNNTILLPKIFVERELPLADSVINNSSQLSPRDKLMLHYIQHPNDVNEHIPLSTIADAKLSNRDSVVPANSPVKYFEDESDPDEIKPLSKEDSFVNSEKYGHLTSRSQCSRISEVPIVSLGDEIHIEYTRRYKPGGRSSVAGTDISDYETTRPSTIESRYALSTPGRRTRNSKKRDLSLSHQEIPVSRETAGQSRGAASRVVIAEEDNLVHDFVVETERLGKGRIRTITFGDPVKDTNKQDKKLNNSKLDDLYKRGIVQSQSSDIRIQTPRTQRALMDMLFSRASGNSNILGNPPPSIATMAPSPSYDIPLGYIKTPIPSNVIDEKGNKFTENDLQVIGENPKKVSGKTTA